MTGKEVANLIQRFLDGTCGRWEWDDFISGARIYDARLREIQSRCGNLSIEFPSAEQDQYCNSEGLAILKGYIAELEGTQN